jgi:GTP pyrophosphokinase
VIEAAHNVSIIRLFTPKDHPTQMPIRKVLLRQLVLKVTHDVRVIIVKIAGRLVTLRKAEQWPEKSRQMIAQEVLDVVVPWCDALGLNEWRQELQELSFRYLSPDKYALTLELMGDHRDVLLEVKEQVTADLESLFARHSVEAFVSGRVKTHYSVYRKMQVYELEYDEVWDRIGIRILTNSVFDCYYIQTAIEEELYTERRRFVDYIEAPRKPYNYQSLHLTVGGPRGISVEIQIRTFDMHIKGEYGVAAHWKMYGGGEGAQSTEDTKFAFLRTQASQLLGDPIDYLGNTLDTLLFNNSILPMDTGGFLLDPDTGERIVDSQGHQVHYRSAATDEKGYVIDQHTSHHILSQSGEKIWHQSEILPDRVIVYTPFGDLRSLPRGATPLDFAYYIHEDVGHTCVGARINGKMQRLDFPLRLGDRVEVITRKNSHPSLDWLYNQYATTRRAKDKIKRFFREKTDEQMPEVEDLGHAIIKKRLSAHKVRDLSLDQLVELFKRKSRAELLEAVGSGEIGVKDIDEKLGQYILDQLSQREHNTHAPLASVNHKEFGLLYAQAQCCLPVPGDDAISYITQGRGFTLHRSDCRNVSTLDPARVSYFDWPDFTLCEEGNLPPPTFACRLIMLVVNPSRTVMHIKDVASTENLPVDAVKMYNDQHTGTQIAITFRVACKEQVDRLFRKLNGSDDILMIRRPIG